MNREFSKKKEEKQEKKRNERDKFNVFGRLDARSREEQITKKGITGITGDREGKKERERMKENSRKEKEKEKSKGHRVWRSDRFRIGIHSGEQRSLVSDSNHRSASRALCCIPVHETVLPRVDIPLCVRAYVADYIQIPSATACSCACLQLEPGSLVVAKGLQVRIKRGIRKGMDAGRKGESIQLFLLFVSNLNDESLV